MIEFLKESNFERLVETYSDKLVSKERKIRIATMSVFLVLTFLLTNVLWLSLLSGFVGYKLRYMHLIFLEDKYKKQLKVNFPIFCQIYVAQSSYETNSITMLRKTIDYIDNKFLKNEIIILFNDLYSDPNNEKKYVKEFSRNIGGNLSKSFMRYYAFTTNVGYDKSREERFVKDIQDVFTDIDAHIFDKVDSIFVLYGFAPLGIIVFWVLILVSTLTEMMIQMMGV